MTQKAYMARTHSLASLPAEIKNEIYRYVVLCPYDIHAISTLQVDWIECEELVTQLRFRKDAVSLMLVSRQTHFEASFIFYGENTFFLYSKDNSDFTKWMQRIGSRNRQFVRKLKVDFRWGHERARRKSHPDKLPCHLETFHAAVAEGATKFLRYLSRGHNLVELSLELPRNESAITPLVDWTLTYAQRYGQFIRAILLGTQPAVERPWFLEELAKLERVKRLRVGVVSRLESPGSLKSQIEESGMVVDELEVFSDENQFFKRRVERTCIGGTWFEPDLAPEWWGINNNRAVVTRFSEKKLKAVEGAKVVEFDVVGPGEAEI